MSRNAVGPAPDRNTRTWSRSRSGCWARIGFVPRRRQGDEREVNLRLQFDVEQGADPRQHTAAERVEITLQQISDHHYRREPEQRCNVTARDYAIVNLQHVKRAGQRQQVDHSAEYSHAC